MPGIFKQSTCAAPACRHSAVLAILCAAQKDFLAFGASRKEPGGQRGFFLPISHHPDQLVEVTRGCGTASRPEDFLDNFTSFVRNNVNEITALAVVVQRPRQLTRAQLRELRLELDRQGLLTLCEGAAGLFDVSGK
jgi:hypothetical protein